MELAKCSVTMCAYILYLKGENLAKQHASTPEQASTELLRDLLILQLGLAKVPQDKIRKIAGCGMNRVNDLLKHIPKSK